MPSIGPESVSRLGDVQPNWDNPSRFPVLWMALRGGGAKANT